MEKEKVERLLKLNDEKERMGRAKRLFMDTANYIFELKGSSFSYADYNGDDIALLLRKYRKEIINDIDKKIEEIETEIEEL